MYENESESSLWKAATITYKSARRLAVAVVGASVVLVGVAMLVLPGPAFVVIPTGLAILGLEFAWARRWLKTIKTGTAKGLSSIGIVLGARAATGAATATGSRPAPSGGASSGGGPSGRSGDVEKVANVIEKHV